MWDVKIKLFLGSVNKTAAKATVFSASAHSAKVFRTRTGQLKKQCSHTLIMAGYCIDLFLLGLYQYVFESW